MNIFNDVKEPGGESRSDLYGQSLLPNVNSIQIGAGTKAFKGDSSGIWLGANKFADAPFSVDLNGNVVANSLLSKTATGQAFSGSILISDGTNTRIHIGYLAGGY
jgi:hypothetical protein